MSTVRRGTPTRSSRCRTSGPHRRRQRDTGDGRRHLRSALEPLRSLETPRPRCHHRRGGCGRLPADQDRRLPRTRVAADMNIPPLPRATLISTPAHLSGRVAAHLAHRLLDGEHPVHAGVGVRQAAAVGVHRQPPARRVLPSSMNAPASPRRRSRGPRDRRSGGGRTRRRPSGGRRRPGRSRPRRTLRPGDPERLDVVKSSICEMIGVSDDSPVPSTYTAALRPRVPRPARAR